MTASTAMERTTLTSSTWRPDQAVVEVLVGEPVSLDRLMDAVRESQRLLSAESVGPATPELLAQSAQSVFRVLATAYPRLHENPARAYELGLQLGLQQSRRSESARSQPDPVTWEVAEQGSLVMTIKDAGFDGVAGQLLSLFSLIGEDPHEPDVSTASLRNLAAFLAEHPGLPPPSVGLDPNGYVDAEWTLPDDSLVVMVFLPDERIRCVAIGSVDASGTRHRRDILEMLKPLPFGAA